jgi:protein-arginine kinase activator protein McsA
MGEEETEIERRRRWIERAAAKTRPKKVRCAKCGKEVDEFMEIAGRSLCLECYFMEKMDEGSAMGMPGEGSGGG